MQTKIERLNELRVQVKILEEEILRERLASLHEEFGFESAAELISELRRGFKVTVGPAKPAGTEGKRKRVVVTPAHRRAIGKDLRKGDKRDPAIAAAHGVSLTTVQRIKGEMGLQAKRKKKR